MIKVALSVALNTQAFLGAVLPHLQPHRDAFVLCTLFESAHLASYPRRTRLLRTRRPDPLAAAFG